jgi:hypothetical protein
MLRLGAIVLKVSDTSAEPWSEALGYRRAINPDFLLPGDASQPRLHLDTTDRTHLDLWGANAAEQAEVERLVGLEQPRWLGTTPTTPFRARRRTLFLHHRHWPRRQRQRSNGR